MAIYEQEINSFLASAVPAGQQNDRIAANQRKDAYLPDGSPATPEYFDFNPNKLPVSDWKRLGLSDRQIRNIKNYEAKGGTYHRKEDLKKMYTINEADFKRLEPYIQLADTNAVKKTTPPAATTMFPAITRPVEATVDLHIELNTADSLVLQQLPGIGPVYASRIVRFRDRLGGFYELGQLLGVYGMDSARYNRLLPHLRLDNSVIIQININTAYYEELNNHPLISPKQANAIVAYRKQHGNYQDVNDLLKIVVIDADFLQRAGPYLSIATN